MRATEFVHSYFDAWNHFDPQAVADHLAPDGLYCDIPQNVRRTHDELIVSLNRFFADYRLRYELMGDVLTSKGTVAFQYRMLPLDGQRDERSNAGYLGAEFVTLQSNAALIIRDYYDMPGGAMAPLPSPPLPQPRGRRRKYAKSGLGERQLLDHKTRLEQVMHADQLYLQSELTLPQLACVVGCSVNHLSQVINAGFGVSFFDYLNHYRIGHARELLGSCDDAIVSIAFAVGFNSNSAFYAAFRKYVGQTPAQFRRHVLACRRHRL